MTAKKELFIVEGKSAASTLQQAIHKSDQCILALQGKLINVAKATPAKVQANIECSKIFQSLDCGIGNECKPGQLKHSRVLILMDPDIDGAHSRALVLSLFDQYLRPLVDSGLVSVIIPPFFRVSIKRAGHDQYAWNEQERDQLIGNIDNNNDVVLTRFKGVAQFSQNECAQLLLDPNTRKQIDLG